jgi:hypothetical protein
VGFPVVWWGRVSAVEAGDDMCGGVVLQAPDAAGLD